MFRTFNESTGLVITGKIADAINDIASYSAGNCNPKYLDDCSAYKALDAADVRVCVFPGFKGKARGLKGRQFFQYNGDAFFCMPSKKSPDLFSAAYGSFDELVEEFRGELADAGYKIPKDVIAEYICEISGTYFF